MLNAYKIIIYCEMKNSNDIYSIVYRFTTPDTLKNVEQVEDIAL